MNASVGGWIWTMPLKMVDLLRLAAGPERPQLAASLHSENSAGFPGRQDGPVKGMGFDAGSDKRHLSVLFQESEETVRFPGRRLACRCRLSLELIELRPPRRGRKAGRVTRRGGPAKR
jgi:hypothetical protein